MQSVRSDSLASSYTYVQEFMLMYKPPLVQEQFISAAVD